MKTHKNNLLTVSKTKLLSDKLKLLDTKMDQLKMERSKLLAMGKTKTLAGLDKFKSKGGK